MSTPSNLSNLALPQNGKTHLVSSQNRQAPRGLAARMMVTGPGKMVVIDPGETFILADVKGAGKIVRIWMTSMTLPGNRYNVNYYGLLRFYWDGEAQPSVEAPFGAFFGVPWGKYTHYIAEPLSCTSGGYNCQFPMPYSQGFRIEVVNQSPVPWPDLFYQIQ